MGFKVELKGMDLPIVRSYTCEAAAVFILRLSTETFAVYNRHEIPSYSWAVDFKLAPSRTTPFVRSATFLDEDPSSPISASPS